MDLHYQREIGVGTLVLAGVALFVGGTMWLKGTSFRSTARTAEVRFGNIAGLQPDNVVTISGYEVGKIKTIRYEGPGKLMVTITVPPDLELHTDATAEIVSSLFASGSTLSLNPGSPAAPALPEGQVIQGLSGNGLFTKGEALADRADSVLIGVQSIVNQKTADELTATLQSMQRVLNTMNQRLPQTTDEAQRTMVALRKVSETLDSTLRQLPVGTAIARVDTLAGNMSTMSIQLTATGARLDSLLQKINAGEGTIGKFATDTGLYTDSRAALQSLKILLDELNKNPGKLSIQVKLF